MVMVLEPFPFLQLWQNHSPAVDGSNGSFQGWQLADSGKMTGSPVFQILQKSTEITQNK
jgi:hypothetical protein